jgi:hypothetical protein
VTIRAAAACAATCVTMAMLTIGVGPLGTPVSWVGFADSRAGHGAAARYAESAPPGFSGGFGEQTCHACHFHADLNAEPGGVTLSGVPERFVSGERYALTVTVTRPGLALGGFQLTARLEDGGAQAGTLAPAAGEEERLGIDVQGAIQYANQRRKGAAPVAPDTTRWALDWTAPETRGPVVFHVAANAADGDERVEGDYVHTAVVMTSPNQTGPVRHPLR